MNYQLGSFIGGMNSDMDGSLTRADQYQMGVNISSRGGSPRTRPILSQIEASLPDGLFQGSTVYSLDSADRLVLAIAGDIYTYNLETSVLTKCTNASTKMDANTDTFWFCQAEQYLVIQDGINIPIILNRTGSDPDVATKAVRAAGANEIPIGTVMAYGHGRISVALRELGGSPTTERFFAVGDIMLPQTPETVLLFTETNYLSEGGAFALPNELGLIHGMAYLKNQQTGNGLGSLIVFARNGASAFKINAPRGQWKDIDISDVLYTGKNVGTFADKSIIAVNNDLVYRSVDGIRTVGYNVAKNEGGSATPSNDTISRTVDKELAEDNQNSMKYCYAAENRNRIFYLTQDTEVAGEHAYKSLLTLDSAILSIYGRTTEPAFDGFWTGLNFTSINVARIGGFYEAFITAKGSAGENTLYYVNESDAAYLDNDTSSPVCRIYTGAKDMGVTQSQYERVDRRNIGKFEFAEIWASDIIGECSFTVYWRPYGHTLWLPTPTGTVHFDATGKPGLTQAMRFAASTDVVGENLQINMNMAKMVEFCVEWTGRARIDAVIIEMSDHACGINASCENTGESVTITDGEDGDELNDFAYEIS